MRLHEMRRYDLLLIPAAIFLGGCSGESGAAPQRPTHAPEVSQITFQAVDAGTGAALIDRRMTVRYLVRTPITLDTTAVERVAPEDPYRIAHPVSSDSLVVEVRLEAPSYHRIDTVFAVGRGASSGPFTVRMARRLARVASAGARPPAEGGRPPTAATRPPPKGQAAPAPTAARPQPSVPRPSAPPPDPDARTDRTALRAGDRAFRKRDWAGATTAYERMPQPRSRSSSYARAYQQALVRNGISHMKLGEWGGALTALEDAVSFGSPGLSAYLYLGMAQCAVGRIDDGRATLERAAGLPSSVATSERPSAAALLLYGRAGCSYREFELATKAMDIVRTGGKAVKEYRAFIQRGEAVRARTPQLNDALVDARSKVESIRNRIRRGGGR